MRSGYRFALALSASLVLLAYKGIAIAPLSPVPVALGWLLESAVLLSLWLVTEPACARGPRLLRGVSRVLFVAVLETLFLSSLAHTFFFESAAERRFSLLELDLKMLVFFFREVLPLRGALLLSALWLTPHLLALFLRRAVPERLSLERFPRQLIVDGDADFGLDRCRRAQPGRGPASTTAPTQAKRPSQAQSTDAESALGRVLLATVGGWGVLALLLTRVPGVPSPVADMAASAWETLTTPKVTVDRARSARFAPNQLDKSASRAVDAPLAYDKVLVFVMETMTADTMARERRALPASTFVNRVDPQAHVYTRYFATNQDSRTGMLSMLGSRFIPYESYTEHGRDAYLKLAERSSLVHTFKQRGYRSVFAVSQRELELVVADLPWDERVHLEEGDVERYGKQFLCFVPYEFEHSCEDRALLPRVLEAVDRHPRVFLYYEFIWGHASEYNKASGKTNTEYYSAFIDEVIAHLTQRGELARTLIVLTSDHGFRDKGLQSSRSVYELPLLFHAPGMTGARNARLYSHLDFKDLLLHELTKGSAPPAPSPFVMVVGPTGTGFVAVVTEPGAFMLLKSRDQGRYLVHAEGLPEGTRAPLLAADYLRLFDDYLVDFAKL